MSAKFFLASNFPLIFCVKIVFTYDTSPSQALIDLPGSAKELLRIKVKVALLPDLLISKQRSLAG